MSENGHMLRGLDATPITIEIIAKFMMLAEPRGHAYGVVDVGTVLDRGASELSRGGEHRMPDRFTASVFVRPCPLSHDLARQVVSCPWFCQPATTFRDEGSCEDQ